MSSFVQTQTGVPFFPAAPLASDIHIEDIAHSLSMQCRYNGHTDRFYSVAEHCFILSHTVSPENAQWALLHDAGEAYIGDMVYPLKQVIPEFTHIEATIMEAVCVKFGLVFNQPDQVTDHDRRIVIDERRSLMSNTRTPWPALEGYDPLGVRVIGWTPHKAKVEFLGRYHRLFQTRNTGETNAR